MPQNRKFQNFVENKYMADDAIAAAEIADNAVGNAALGAFQPKHLAFEYDFADLGGSTGAITLTDTADAAQTIPDNAVITAVTLETITPFSSGGSATVAIGVTGNTDAFIAATAFNNAAFTSTAKALTNEVPLKLDGAKSVLFTVATAALDDGKYRIHVEYLEGA